MEHAILPTRGTAEVKGGPMHPARHITGTTRLYGLVGDPLAKAKSPELLNRLFIEQGADAVCVPFGVKADDLSAFVTGARAMRNLSGVGRHPLGSCRPHAPMWMSHARRARCSSCSTEAPRTRSACSTPLPQERMLPSDRSAGEGDPVYDELSG